MSADYEQYARTGIEALFGSVDPVNHEVAWFEEQGARHTFVTFAVKAQDDLSAAHDLIRGIDHDSRKEQGAPIVDKKQCRLAWRMFPHIQVDEDDGKYIAICRLCWWPMDVAVDPFMRAA